MQRHETDAVALTFGLIFLGIAGAWLLVTAGGADITGLRYFFPVLLLGAGGAGVAASLLRNTRSRDGSGAMDTPGDRT